MSQTNKPPATEPPMTAFERHMLASVTRKNDLLERIADSLLVIAQNSAPKAPNYRFTLAEYAAFDPAAIGAQELGRDDFGITLLAWGGYTWKRRSPNNDFEDCIFFSRPDGVNESGKTNYVRLVTFKDQADAKSLPRDVRDQLDEAPRSKPIAPPKPEPETHPAIKLLLTRERLGKPSAVLEYLDNPVVKAANVKDVFWLLVEVFKIDNATARDILTENKVFGVAVRALDQHVF